MVRRRIKRTISRIQGMWLSLLFSLKYSGNTIKSHAFYRRLKFRISGRGNLIFLKKGCYINNVVIEISGDQNEIVFDDNTIFSEGGRIRIEGNNNKLYIGEKSNLVNVFFSMGDDNNSVVIGKDCLLSSEVVIRNWDNHSIVMVDCPEMRICHGKSVVLGDHVWVSKGVTILKGVHIGNDSIIGTMSVVASDIQPNTIAVGNPAKPVKTGVTWCREWLEKCI